MLVSSLHRVYFILLCFIFFNGNVSAQTPKRICVMGSSSTYGYFGNPELYPRDSAWAFKLKKYFKTLGIIDTLFNIGVLGADPYVGMPTSFVPPPGRDLPDARYNITKAVNLVPKPDVIIVNFPTNHYDWLTPAEIIHCLQVIKDSANAKNIRCYITTTQPRDGFSPSERLKLKDLKILIENTFGEYAIDFWTSITLDSNLKIKPELALGDHVHLNPSGHTLLFEKVLEKNIFFSVVPAKFGKISASRTGKNVRVSWQIFEEVNTDKYLIERSKDGITFFETGSVNSKGNSSVARLYDFTEEETSFSTLYYRIAAKNFNGDKQYSPIVLLEAQSNKSSYLYPAATQGNLSLQLGLKESVKVQVTLTDMMGRNQLFTNCLIDAGVAYPLDVQGLKAGSYLLTAYYAGKRQSFKFIKL